MSVNQVVPVEVVVVELLETMVTPEQPIKVMQVETLSPMQTTPAQLLVVEVVLVQ
jgi:hypothetical protein